METTAANLLQSINICDIVEINRIFYSHFVFHIGGGICVHVRKEDGETVKVAERLVDIAGNNFVKVNNSASASWLLFAPERSAGDAIRLATDGLPVDCNGDVILGSPINISYFLLSSNNCEGWCNYWKYKHDSGWSMQANNVAVHSTVGTVERLSGGAAAALQDIMTTEDTPSVVRVFAAASMVPYVAVNVAAAGVRHATNFMSSIFTSWLENPYVED